MFYYLYMIHIIYKITLAYIYIDTQYIALPCLSVYMPTVGDLGLKNYIPSGFKWRLSSLGMPPNHFFS